MKNPSCNQTKKLIFIKKFVRDYMMDISVKPQLHRAHEFWRDFFKVFIHFSFCIMVTIIATTTNEQGGAGKGARLLKDHFYNGGLYMYNGISNSWVVLRWESQLIGFTKLNTFDCHSLGYRIDNETVSDTQKVRITQTCNVAGLVNCF